jgi:hypothetical protein
VCERTHDLPPRNLPRRVSLSGLYLPQPGIDQSGGQLQTRKSHGGRRLLQRRKRAVQIERDAVGDQPDFVAATNLVPLREFDQELLRVAVAEVKARGFEHQALEDDDAAGVGVEDLCTGDIIRKRLASGSATDGTDVPDRQERGVRMQRV